MALDLDLRFGPDPSLKGFTPAGIAAFDDLRPAAVVRELIQNSLDAARDAGETTAIVRFQLTECGVDEIPGIESYRRAFSRAMKFQKSGDGALPPKAKGVANTIQNALNQKTLTVLAVLDNGIGLDTRRMDALLSDGVSRKEGGSMGTYGNGHSVAIPASDLRYALYGGVTDDGRRISAGHAVLASHVGEHPDFASSGDGFLVHGFLNGRNGRSFECAEGRDVPGFIACELDDIARMSVHGTAVVLPAFNNFRETNRTLWDMVAEAAACNFFVAIEEGALEVWVETPGDDASEHALDASTLGDVLEMHRERKRSRAFLSGERAFDAYQTLRFGKRNVVATSEGELEIRLRTDVKSTRIELCRNGMWITHDREIPGFYYKFGDRAPFHAVLLLDAAKGRELHRLVQESEGPLHDKIRLKNLEKNDRKRLRTSLGEVREWIRANTAEIGSDSYTVDDFLAIDFGAEGNGAGGVHAPGFWGTPTVVKRRVPTRQSGAFGNQKGRPGGRGGSGKQNALRPRRSPVLNSAFQVVSVPVGAGRRRIRLTCNEACPEAILRLRVHENVDATCDVLYHEVVPVILGDVLVNGRRAAANNLVMREGLIVGVRLGALSAGTSVGVEASYRLPGEFGQWHGIEPALRVDILDREPGNGKTEASSA